MSRPPAWLWRLIDVALTFPVVAAVAQDDWPQAIFWQLGKFYCEAKSVEVDWRKE